MASTNLQDLRLDFEELEEIHKSAKRSRVQEILLKELNRVRQEIGHLEAKAATQTSQGQSVTSVPVLYEENITNYAWDQSDKFVKIYLTLSNLNDIKENDILSTFTNRSVIVKVQFPNKISTLHITRLAEDVDSNDCYCKKKSDYVLVMLKKSKSGKTWSCLTEREKKTKDMKKPDLDKDADPSESLTKMLKQMYDEGDDDMKRSISKAYYESQKKGQSMDGSFGAL